MTINIDQEGDNWIITMDEQWDVTEKAGQKILKDFWKQKMPFTLLRPREGMVRFDMQKYNFATPDPKEFMAELNKLLELKLEFSKSQLLTDIIPDETGNNLDFESPN